MSGTYKIKYKLTKQEQGDLFENLARALAYLKTPEETASFLRDLLSEGEVLMLARRLQIAELLLGGLTYEEISTNLKVSHGTISRVGAWLAIYGDGYRRAVDRIAEKKENPVNSPPSFARTKRKYPLYFWPELLLKEIKENATQREKRRLDSIIEELKEKGELSKDLAKFL